MQASLAVIIPCLNEEENLKKLLPQLCKRMDVEVVVVDGGSSDGSRDVAATFHCGVLQSKRGRGRQMNTGVRSTTSPYLLFLHADTKLPENFPDLINNTLGKNGVAGGAFSLATDRNSAGLRLICWGANIRSQFFHLPYGDQAIFTTRKAFDGAGGYPEMAIMEDFVFIKNLGKQGRIVILKDRAVTSARRWENVGLLSTTLINQLVILGYRLGISPEKLAIVYKSAKGLGRKKE